MPLLGDAKNCFVGHTQIKQIYAGTLNVWPQDPVTPNPIQFYKRELSTQTKFSILFSFKDITCGDMFNIYLNTEDGSGGWVSYPYSVGEYNINTPNNFNVYIPYADQFLWDDGDGFYGTLKYRMEVRKNGVSTFGPAYSLPSPSTLAKVPPELQTNQCT